MPGGGRHEKDTFNCSRICVTLRVPQREHYAKGLRIVFRQLRADSVPAVNPRIAELESLTASNERCGNRYTSFTTKEARFLLSEIERKDEASKWRPFDSAPKDGREILAAFPKQGNAVIMVRWSTIHGYWVSKGEPQLGIGVQSCLWANIPALSVVPAGREEGEDECGK